MASGMNGLLLHLELFFYRLCVQVNHCLAVEIFLTYDLIGVSTFLPILFEIVDLDYHWILNITINPLLHFILMF